LPQDIRKMMTKRFITDLANERASRPQARSGYGNIGRGAAGLRAKCRYLDQSPAYLGREHVN
jgi:hypothetical protein